MKLGLTMSFGETADTDPGKLRDVAHALEEQGVDYLEPGGHILSTEVGRYPDRPEPQYAAAYRDSFVLFSYLASFTSRLRFRTSLFILPLYPTALVARQAADVAFVTGGRLELGVGVSWMEPEFKALGQELRGRGRRMEHQIELLRRFWTEPFVTWQDDYHDIDNVGLKRLPPPIPIWIGAGHSDKLIRRVARLGDGWIPLGGIGSRGPVERLRAFAEEEGRDPTSIRVRGFVPLAAGAQACAEAAAAQQSFGVTDLSIFAPPGTDLAPTLETFSAIQGALPSEEQ